MYEKTTSGVVVGEGAPEEFEVNIRLRLGSVLSPLLFMAVLDLISRKAHGNSSMQLALVANGQHELQETLEEWNGLFTRHGLKINLEKTDRSAAHMPPEGRAGHRAGGEETDSGGGQFRISRRGSVRRRRERKGERGTSKSTGRSECVESS